MSRSDYASQVEYRARLPHSYRGRSEITTFEWAPNGRPLLTARMKCGPSNV